MKPENVAIVERLYGAIKYNGVPTGQRDIDALMTAAREEGRQSALSALQGRPCTCHPDDNPPTPCAGKFALSECLSQDPGHQPCGSRDEAGGGTTAALALSFDEVEQLHADISGLIRAGEQYVPDEAARREAARAARAKLAAWLNGVFPVNWAGLEETGQ